MFASSGQYKPTHWAIEMKGVHVRRGPVHILAEVEWSLPTGARCVVLGPNGSGKTTLMRVVTGFMWPSEGTVEVLGQRLGQTDVRQLRKRIGVVDPSEQYGVDQELTALDAVLTGYFGTLGLYEPTTAEQQDHAEHLLDCGVRGMAAVEHDAEFVGALDVVAAHRRQATPFHADRAWVG